ncbi:WD repeat-containing protein 76 [Seminavis robusta]|uniref:WD repeat-containing protein 76 n=1 Tax=Seminavis robusta TaxID=568900 RepID=A0A9N8E5C0_9STRA|nr:WD repeat-containing protein 76 [Seminavis robusta]|eukprot:Sro565_g167550.1 WD repeat-containing protein 76 (612) ;mRNA; f:14868-16818
MPKTKAAINSTKDAPGRRRSSRINKNLQEEQETTPKDTHSESENESDNEEQQTFEFEGNTYASYQEMVNAKRKRNENYLKQNGLWNPIKQTIKSKEASQNGIKRRKVTPPKAPMRKSNRLAGTPADGRFVEHEGGGGFVIVAAEASKDGVVTKTTTSTRNSKSLQQSTTVIVTGGDRNHSARVNDGAPLSLEDAVQNCDGKWIQENSVPEAQKFTQDTLKPIMTVPVKEESTTTNNGSPTSVAAETASPMETVRSKIEQLSIDDDNHVAKVTPDRIYGLAVHPSTNKLIVGAGDKLGYVGLWNVDATGDTDGVYLFRPHTRPVNTLEWTPQGLLSSSYDGTVRYMDVAKESFEEVFASNPSDEEQFYTQYLALDPRASIRGQSFFLSTSMGSVMHVDRRVGAAKGNITFHAMLSEKKINTVSLHRDGYCLATAGLDRTVKFWDLRKMTTRKKVSNPFEPKAAYLGEHFNEKSVNSAFFSPSGDYLMTTNMAHTLNIYHKAHLQLTTSARSSGGEKKENLVEPIHMIRHDNHTGRWLATFMAQWHPSLDIFCVGSMAKPRAVDVYDGESGDHMRAIRGETLSSVFSRCCFHPSLEHLILVGGNSSGRVSVIR